MHGLPQLSTHVRRHDPSGVHAFPQLPPVHGEPLRSVQFALHVPPSGTQLPPAHGWPQLSTQPSLQVPSGTHSPQAPPVHWWSQLSRQLALHEPSGLHVLHVPSGWQYSTQPPPTQASPHALVHVA